MFSAKKYHTMRLLTYKVNRPLSDAEIKNHLPQKKPSLSAPWFQLTVIRMNSVFLECVDKFYAWRGALTTLIIPSFFVPIGLMALPLDLFEKFPTLTPEKQTEALIAAIVLYLMSFLLLALQFWALRVECFRFTHYPTRFNRKTRMVHVFRPNNTVLSVPWDKVYFTLMYHGYSYWEVVGHILSEDGKTVLDTFPLSTQEMRDDDNPKTALYQHWEFVRRYMEDGPQNLYNQVAVILPIDEKKETFFVGFKRLLANFGFIPLGGIIFLPLVLCLSIGRWIAMRTCKLPRFPKEVESECKIEPNDPYIRDKHHLASWDDMIRRHPNN